MNEQEIKKDDSYTQEIKESPLDKFKKMLTQRKLGNGSKIQETNTSFDGFYTRSSIKHFIITLMNNISNATKSILNNFSHSSSKDTINTPHISSITPEKTAELTNEYNTELDSELKPRNQIIVPPTLIIGKTTPKVTSDINNKHLSPSGLEVEEIAIDNDLKPDKTQSNTKPNDKTQPDKKRDDKIQADKTQFDHDLDIGEITIDNDLKPNKTQSNKKLDDKTQFDHDLDI